MIRHQQREVDPPIAALMAERNGFQQLRGNVRPAKLVYTARPAAQGQKENRLVRPNPKRNVVGDYFAARSRRGGATAPYRSLHAHPLFRW